MTAPERVEAAANALVQYETGGTCESGRACGLCDCGMAWATPEQRAESAEMDRDRASFALGAADALLREDAAVERVARAIAWEHSGIDDDDWADGGAMSVATKESFRELARAAIAALLGEA